MNAHTYKIVCPSCGATSGFTEAAPNRYTCGYCGTTFEHLSVLPTKNQERILYDYFMQVLADHQSIPDDNPDKTTMMYSAMVRMSGALEGLSNSKNIHKVKLQYHDFIIKELQRLQLYGIKSFNSVQDVVAADAIAETKFYANGAFLLAKSYKDHSSSKETLEEALELITQADTINQRLFQTYDHEYRGLQLELLKQNQLHDKFKEVLLESLKVEDSLYVKRLRYRFKEDIKLLGIS